MRVWHRLDTNAFNTIPLPAHPAVGNFFKLPRPPTIRTPGLAIFGRFPSIRSFVPFTLGITVTVHRPAWFSICSFLCICPYLSKPAQSRAFRDQSILISLTDPCLHLLSAFSQPCLPHARVQFSVRQSVKFSSIFLTVRLRAMASLHTSRLSTFRFPAKTPGTRAHWSARHPIFPSI